MRRKVIFILLTFLVDYGVGIRKCCKYHERYSTTSRLCVTVPRVENFTEVSEDFAEQFRSYRTANYGSFCLDLTEEGKFVVISEKKPSEYISYCFNNSKIKDCIDYGEELIMKGEFDNVGCGETIVTTDDKHIRFFEGRERDKSYSVRSCSSDSHRMSEEKESDRISFRKCCQENELFDETFQCIKTESVTRPTFYGYNLEAIDESDVLALSAPTELMHCRINRLGFELNGDDYFGVLPDGNLLLLDRSCKNRAPSLEHIYCFEKRRFDNGTETEGVFRCNSKKQESEEPIWLYRILMIISLPFLLVTLIVYLMLPKIGSRNYESSKQLPCVLQNKIVMSQVFSLFMLFLLLVVLNQLSFTVFPALSPQCIVLGVVTHFFYLASFSWLLVEGIRLISAWNQKFRHSRINKSYACYSVIGWGVPASVIGLGLSVQFSSLYQSGLSNPSYGCSCCFINSYGVDKPQLWYLGLPIGILLLLNFMIFIRSAVEIVKLGAKTNNRKVLTLRLNVVLRLSLAMGLSWILEAPSFLFPKPAKLWMIADLLNISTSIYLFYFYICKKTIAEQLYNEYPKLFPFLKKYSTKRSTVITSQQTTSRMTIQSKLSRSTWKNDTNPGKSGPTDNGISGMSDLSRETSYETLSGEDEQAKNVPVIASGVNEAPSALKVTETLMERLSSSTRFQDEVTELSKSPEALSLDGSAVCFCSSDHVV